LRFNFAKELADEFNSIFNGETISTSTRRYAQLARKTVPAARSTSWSAIGWGGMAALIIIGIAFAAFRIFPSFLGLGGQSNQTFGRVSYTDFNYVVDRASISFAGLPPLEEGLHYEIWYLAGGGEQRQNIGRIDLDETGNGQLTFTDPEQRNLLEVFDQIEITEESDNDPDPHEPSGNVVASFIYPPLSFVHIRHLLVKFDTTPNETSLIYGLWSAADGIETSTFELQQAFIGQDEILFRQKTEEVINQLVGSSDAARYRDWDEDGTVADPGDGFGLLNDGYITHTDSHTKFAMQAADASENINLHGENVLACLENMAGWSEQLLEKALILNDMPFGTTMEPLINEMVTLAKNNASGVDSNASGSIEPIAGEGGAATAYEYAYSMADMLLLPGAGQIPPPIDNPRE
jgi:hypothetical protein